MRRYADWHMIDKLCKTRGLPHNGMEWKNVAFRTAPENIYTSWKRFVVARAKRLIDLVRNSSSRRETGVDSTQVAGGGVAFHQTGQLRRLVTLVRRNVITLGLDAFITVCMEWGVTVVVVVAAVNGNVDELSRLSPLYL